MKIVIAGASGMIGTPLVAGLRDDGVQVITLVRHEPSGAGKIRWDPAAGVIPPDALAGADAVINLAGAGIADKRWTPAYKELIVSSRLQTTTLLATTMAGMPQKPAVFLSGSAIGFYGNTEDRSVDETATQGQGFLVDVCIKWEAATAAASDAGIRVVHLRTGLVLAKKGGVLGQQLIPAKLGLGGKLGSGKQYQSWITLQDEVAAIRFLLTAKDVSGPVNLTAPSPVTQARFAKVLGGVLHRPAFAVIPGFAIRLLFDGFADEGILVGQRVVPAKLVKAGFTFGASELEDGLRQALA